MNEDLDKRYVLRQEHEELKAFAIKTHRKVRGMADDLKEVEKKMEDDLYDDSLELDISKGRLKLGRGDIGSLIVIGLLATVILGVWGLVK
ncbi:hypothetical protein SAMN02745150_01383 [Brevinema andersonii]|uniref:Uncharacterized protein n=1 Tax=Brevinema andersonii TaxID=34097 RepID=A0A1I1F366_BREAD|nr:hypothetical protein [Brevinema andersonii]SFB93711.1 hypothetical protein SAMN02745150_01383 [Brevinema andersonii]